MDERYWLDVDVVDVKVVVVGVVASHLYGDIATVSAVTRQIYLFRVPCVQRVPQLVDGCEGGEVVGVGLDADIGGAGVVVEAVAYLERCMVDGIDVEVGHDSRHGALVIVIGLEEEGVVVGRSGVDLVVVAGELPVPSRGETAAAATVAVELLAVGQRVLLAGGDLDRRTTGTCCGVALCGETVGGVRCEAGDELWVADDMDEGIKRRVVRDVQPVVSGG